MHLISFRADPFVFRQFDDPEYKGTRLDCSKEDFCVRVNEHHQEKQELAEGYASH
jgi:hypothetical protein